MCNLKQIWKTIKWPRLLDAKLILFKITDSAEIQIFIKALGKYSPFINWFWKVVSDGRTQLCVTQLPELSIF